jgi:homoserine kinase
LILKIFHYLLFFLCNPAFEALLVDSLHRGDLSYLVTACQDKLHQPVRAKHAFPHLEPMIDAAIKAGAHGCFLSGAGPTVMAICSGASGDIFAQKSDERQEQVVADAMRMAADALPSEHSKWGEGVFYICSPATRGAHVVSAEPRFSDALKTFGSLSGVM